MQITGLHTQTIAESKRSATRPAAADDRARDAQSASGSRALIPLSPARNGAPPQPLTRHPANFLAHLIATEQALPQTRERRRIEPGVAVSVYAAARDQVPTSETHALSRAA